MRKDIYTATVDKVCVREILVSNADREDSEIYPFTVYLMPKGVDECIYTNSIAFMENTRPHKSIDIVDVLPLRRIILDKGDRLVAVSSDLAKLSFAISSFEDV